MTQPVVVLTNVTDTGWKLGGTGPDGPAAVIGEFDGVGGVYLLPVPAGCAVPPLGVGRWPLAAGPATWVGVTRSDISGGVTTTATATTAAADATLIASLRSLRRRARRVISSKVPSGGGSGRTCCSSQPSSRSRWSSAGIGLPPSLVSLAVFPLREGLLQPGPGMVQVCLDRAVGPLEQHRDLPDPEPGVVVQQERVAQPGRQLLDELAHVYVLRRIGERLGPGVRRDGAHRPSLPLHLAPVVPHQVRRDHVQVALRVVELGGARPLGQQPHERLGGDLVGGLVV